VIFKDFNYGDLNEQKMVGEADLALLESSYLVGATTSDMRNRFFLTKILPKMMVFIIWLIMRGH
jgi:hypothetical protein